jgi:hypothetical protein
MELPYSYVGFEVQALHLNNWQAYFRQLGQALKLGIVLHVRDDDQFCLQSDFVLLCSRFLMKHSLITHSL